MRTTADYRRELAEEALDRPRRRRLAPVLALVPGVLGCAQAAPQPPAPEVVRLDAEERASYERTIEALRGEAAANAARVIALEQRLADRDLAADPGAVDATAMATAARLRGELDACRGEVARYQGGLERAVSELNARATPSTAPASPRPSRRDYGNIHSATPQVRVTMTDVRVEGRLYSSRDSNTQVTVVVRLLENERQVDVERIGPVVVGAHGGREYVAVFPGAPSSTSSYTAEVTLDY